MKEMWWDDPQGRNSAPDFSAVKQIERQMEENDRQGRQFTLSEGTWVEEATEENPEEDSAGVVSLRLARRFGFELDCIVDEPITRATLAHDLNTSSLNHNPHALGGSRPTDVTNRFSFIPTKYSDKRRDGSWKVKPDYFHMHSRFDEKVKSFQIVSPPLDCGDVHEVMHSLHTVITMLKTLGVRCDPSCGLHIHLDVGHMDLEGLQTFMKVWNSVEEGVDELVPIDRIVHSVEGLASNKAVVQHSEEVRSVEDLVRKYNPTGRFAKVNLTNLVLPAPYHQETVEFRFHHAVLDPTAIMCCAGLAGAILYNPHHSTLENFKKIKTPFAKLLSLAPPGPFATYLQQRRTDVKQLHLTYFKNILERSGSGYHKAALQMERVKMLRDALGTDLTRKMLKSKRNRVLLQKEVTQSPALLEGGVKGELGVDRSMVLPPPSQSHTELNMYKSDITAQLSSRQVLAAPGGQLLSYHAGPRSIIAPRDHAHRTAFPLVTTSGMVQSVDSTLSLSTESKVGKALSPNHATPRHFLPDDAMDPLPEGGLG